ncbi:MAG: cytochrome c biogenesis protein ResB [Candidatus Hydrogenedentes bacterium]|nr:cytochrome c biogenesis protein ResB [Candidatus Hydrogenedentota bacterium]
MLPFTIRLDKFTRELYPGTEIAKTYASDVTRTEGEASQAVRIAMNEPMRYRGYTFYQSSWGPPGAGPHDRLYSSLAVVHNPAEQLPVYACYVIALGLTIHFAVKLGKYLRAQRQGVRT